MSKFYSWKADGDRFSTLYDPSSTVTLSPHTPMNEIAEPISLTVATDSRGQLPIGDLVHIGGNQPKLLSARAYEILLPYLQNFGVIKKAALHNGTEYYVFYITNVLNCLDTTKSEIIIRPSGYKKLKKAVLSTGSIGENNLFSVKDFYSSEIYISHEVYELIICSNLTGGIFEQVETDNP